MTCDRSVVFFTNKTDGHNITEMPLKMALNTINHLHSFTFIYLFERCYKIFKLNLVQFKFIKKNVLGKITLHVCVYIDLSINCCPVTNISCIFMRRTSSTIYSQTCVKEHLYITNHCLSRTPLYNKSLSIKNTSI